MNEEPGERRSSGGGIITNPAIVKSALSKQQQQKAPAKRSGKKNPAKSTTSTLEAINVTAAGSKKPSKKPQARPKSESKAQPQSQPQQANKANKPRSEGSAVKPKPKKGGQKKSPPGTPKRNPPGEEDPDIELKKILYPDLYGAGNSGESISGNSANSTPRKKNNNNGNNKRAVSTPAGKGFAGSSFSSSPAPSALPKPSFGVKQSTPEVSASSGSLFDQFMMADRQERMNKSSSIAANH